jgi:hypothetical protein
VTFQNALASVLHDLGQTQDESLIISDVHSRRYVQFYVDESMGLHAEAASNNCLSPARALSVDQERALLALGWSPPSWSFDDPPGTSPSGGSCNFVRLFVPPVPFDEAARLAVETLTDVLCVSDPSDLDYHAFFDEGDEVVLLPILGIARRPPSEPLPPGTVNRGRVLGAAAIASGERGQFAPLEIGRTSTIVRRTMTCFCGQPAPTIRLDRNLFPPPADPALEHTPQSVTFYVEYCLQVRGSFGFRGSYARIVAPRLLDEVRSALADGDWEKLASIDHSYAPTYCTECHRHYCLSHLDAELRYGEDYDIEISSFTCPEQHDLVLRLWRQPSPK